MTPDPTDNRATAERIATERDVRRNNECEAYIRSLRWHPETPDDVRSIVIANVRSAWYRGGEAREAEFTHRDRTAEREAARKAWDAAVSYTLFPRDMWDAYRNKYLAAEFDAGERVEVVLRAAGSEQQGYIVVLTPEDAARIVRLASQRGAER